MAVPRHPPNAEGREAEQLRRAEADEELLEGLPPEPVAPEVRPARAFRQAVQLMRQVSHTLEPEDSLRDRLEEAVRTMNRDEVDARRKLELG